MVRSALGSAKMRSAPGFALRSGALPKERGVRVGAPPKERRSPFESGERRKVEHSCMYKWLILFLLANTIGEDRLKRFSERDWWRVLEGEVRKTMRKILQRRARRPELNERLICAIFRCLRSASVRLTKTLSKWFCQGKFIVRLKM